METYSLGCPSRRGFWITRRSRNLPRPRIMQSWGWGGATLLPVATKAMHETHIEITYLAHNSIGWAPCHVVEKQAKDGGLHSRNRCSHAWSKLDCF
jgi:hypothetical protein